MSSQYIDCISPILYGIYATPSYAQQTFSRYPYKQQAGTGRKRHGKGPPKFNQTSYAIGQHANSSHPLLKRGGNSSRSFWDYPNPSSRDNNMKTYYGGGDNVLPLPPRYRNHSAYEVGNNYIGGYTQTPVTYIGGRRRKCAGHCGGNISQTKAYVSYNN